MSRHGSLQDLFRLGQTLDVIDVGVCGDQRLAAGKGEIQLADAINIHAQRGLVETVPLNGQRFDCGSVRGFMAASNHEFENRNFQL